MKKGYLLATAAFAALTVGAANAQGPVISHSGELNPFYGELNPFYGELNPFYGELNPFSGELNPFWGELNPFYGELNPFWGELNPFWGELNPFSGELNPFYGELNPFWGDLDPFSGELNPFWGEVSSFWTGVGGDSINTTSQAWLALTGTYDEEKAEYDDVELLLQDLYNQSYDIFAAQIEEQTGQTFWESFAKDLFEKYGIDAYISGSKGERNGVQGATMWIAAESTLADLSLPQRAEFLLEWYDGLNNFSGQDHVDHWMATINWSPMITQDQGSGDDAVIGLIDFAVTGDKDLVDNLVYVGGYDTPGTGHGAAVASLMVAEHDGEGVMGLAPNATVRAWNPFDETGTASWEDITTGVNTLGQDGARIINLSLGIPGWTLHQGWSDLISNPDIQQNTFEVLFVKAAGNDGLVQTTDINWDWVGTNDRLIVVGSVDPNGVISTFSNTPGETCLLTDGVCYEENKLKYRFMVAPGELILASDNDGGVTRYSGTSFSAPLVSGAAALIHDRWPWFKNAAEETIEILFRSAEDLGDPGVDAVYGQGLLDVEAAMSPLSFGNLLYFVDFYGEESFAVTSNSNLVKDTFIYLKENSFDFELNQTNIIAFEHIFANNENPDGVLRDFNIPLSTLLYNQETDVVNGTSERFGRHLHQRFVDWVNGSSFNLGDTNRASVALTSGSNWAVSVSAAKFNQETDYGHQDVRFQNEVAFTNAKKRTAFRLGFGEGAQRLQENDAFGFYSDYDAQTGGVNPILGFASGGTYASFSGGVTSRMEFSLGFSHQQEASRSIDVITGNHNPALNQLPDYEASASVVGLKYELADRVNLSVDYTHLSEADSVMGLRGSGALSIGGGAETDSATAGLEAKVGRSWTLGASATVSHTAATRFDDTGGVSVGEEGLTGTAFAVAADKLGVIGKNDRVRISFSQPLHFENGNLVYQTTGVVDRDTGELGLVEEEWDISSTRDYVAEFHYATPLKKMNAELAAFGRVETDFDDTSGKDTEFTVGGRLGFKF